jgi:hypothetical protein
MVSSNATTQTVDIISVDEIMKPVFVEFLFNNCISFHTSLAQSLIALYILTIKSCGGYSASHKADNNAHKSSVAKLNNSFISFTIF